MFLCVTLKISLFTRELHWEHFYNLSELFFSLDFLFYFFCLNNVCKGFIMCSADIHFDDMYRALRKFEKTQVLTELSSCFPAAFSVSHQHIEGGGGGLQTTQGS